MTNLEDLKNTLLERYGAVEQAASEMSAHERDLEDAELALADRRAAILREYSNPEGPHATNGGIKVLGSNEEQRKAALDGLTSAERQAVAKAARAVATSKQWLEVSRLQLQCSRDMLRIAEMERSTVTVASELLKGIRER